MKKGIKKVKKEFKTSLNTALIAAFGFIVALAWRDYLTEIINNTTSLSPIQGKLFIAISITFLSVLGILIVTFLTRE